jgi:hypothetical protein
MEQQSDQTARITDIQARYADILMKKAHVIGVALGMRKRAGFLAQPLQPVLVVMVDQKVPLEELAPEDRIPPEIEGIPVDVQEMGAFTAF